MTDMSGETGDNSSSRMATSVAALKLQNDSEAGLSELRILRTESRYMRRRRKSAKAVLRNAQLVSWDARS